MDRRSRTRALLLLLTLLGGSFVLPMVDALLFHSTAEASVVGAVSRIGVAETTGPAHALGCAVWTAAASGTGLPSPLPVPSWPLTAVADRCSPLEPASPPQSGPTHTDSRAPPVA